MQLEVTFDSAKNRIDDAMRALFARRKQDASELGATYVRFWDTIESVSMVGGKRLRPYLTMVAYGKIDERIIPVALAQELIHIAMLMHDDVIDQDFVRHGSANVNGLYRDRYESYLDRRKATHYANSAGVLTGDVLIAEAYQSVATGDFDADTIRRVTSVLSTSLFEVIGGELLDVEAAFVDDERFDPLQIYRYKTSSYSFIGPIVTGAYCSGADEETIVSYRTLAENAGIAFQIQDDLLGIYGNSDETGKSTLTDLREAKRTLLVSYHEELMDDQQRERFAAFGDVGSTDEQLAVLKQDMVDSGAQQKTLDAVELYFGRAGESLARLPDGPQKVLFAEFLEKLKGRKK